jgi:hypothetical protein
VHFAIDHVELELEEPTEQACDESLTCQGLNLNLRYFSSFTFISILFGESCLLFLWCAGGRCCMVCSDEDHGRSRRPGAEDQRWLHRLSTQWPGDREVGWRCVQSGASKSSSTVCQWFGLKTTGTVFFCLASKPVVTVSPRLASKPGAQVFLFGPQNRQLRFGDLGLKITAIVS